ncbi:hypothetical protein ACFLRX_08765 [Acidobacteriota bacterium]
MSKFNFFNLSLFILLIIFQTSLAAQTPVVSKKVLIHAEDGWQDSGVKLKVGQFYSIEARGSWVSGYDVPLLGPEGEGDGTITNGALLGMIADKQPAILGYKSYTREIVSRIIYVARGGLFKSNGNGSLWFCMGEWSECKQCSGYMEVLITIFD